MTAAASLPPFQGVAIVWLARARTATRYGSTYNPKMEVESADEIRVGNWESVGSKEINLSNKVHSEPRRVILSAASEADAGLAGS